MKRVAALLITLALIAGMVGCPAAPVQVELNVSSTPGGSVTGPGEGTYTYGAGTVVDLVAEAEQGYRFVNWTGDVDTVANVNAASTSIRVEGDYTITANFIAEYNLTISSTEGGQVTAPGEGAFTYPAGTVVTLLAVVGECYEFVNWTGDPVVNLDSATTSIMMDASKSVTANFALARYNLMVDSTAGGSVSTPGEGTFSYDCGTVVDLAVQSAEGHRFTGWTGDVGRVADVNAASTTIIVGGQCHITANFEEIDAGTPFAGGSGTAGDPYQIANWVHLRNVRDYLDGHYIIIRDLHSTTAGYTDLASPTANQGAGWQPIGYFVTDHYHVSTVDPADPFTGSLDGQGYEIRDLSICRSYEDYVGLFGCVGYGGLVKNIGVVNTEVSGANHVGGLVGYNQGTVSDSYVTGSVAGHNAAGLAGGNQGTISNCYSTSSVTGEVVGGLVAGNWDGTVSNSYYNYDEVVINGRHMITIGALFDEDFKQWLANDKSLSIDERLSNQDGYYLISSVNDFKELLAFGQDDSLKFRLEEDLDLTNEPNLYIPYLAGEFSGNDHRLANLSLDFDSVSQVGLFGYVARCGKITQTDVRNASIRTNGNGIGGLVGSCFGSVSNSCYSGSVTGVGQVGGLVGGLNGAITDSYYSGSVMGYHTVGGLVGLCFGTVSNSYYSYDEVHINGEHIITVGALPAPDFEQWLAQDKHLDVNERLSQEYGHYVINDVDDFKELLAFGQDSALRFRLKSDLDLDNVPNFYIPYLAGEFDGAGHTVANLSFAFDSVGQVGLFGLLHYGASVTDLNLERVNLTGSMNIGGLVGDNGGTVSRSYSTGTVTGGDFAGGLVGVNRGSINESYSCCSVSGRWTIGGLIGAIHGGTANDSYSTAIVSGDGRVGGLVGELWQGSVSKCYSMGSVAGDSDVGGLLGINIYGTVDNPFWDTQASGQYASDGGTGKTTVEMKSIATFSGAGWNIVAVADPGIRNTSHIWNIVEGQTYPFLSWEPVS